MANFTPPFDTTVFLPSKSDLTKWIYDIWVYLRDNPIVSEETVASIIDDYFENNPISFPVQSVNGQTGVVTLKAADVGALPNTYTAPVQSVNGQTGVVTLKAADVGALPNTYTAPVQSVNGQTGAVKGLYDARNPPPYPVTSVNGATGKVSVNSIIDNVNNAMAQATGGTSSAGLIFGSLDSIYGYLMFNSSYDLTIRSNTNQYLGQVYTTLDPPPANLAVASVSIASGTASISRNTITAIYSLRFPLTGSLPAGNTAILQLTSPNLSSLQPLNASVSSGYIQTTLSRGDNYLYLTVTNNLPGESFNGNVILYLYSTVNTTLSVVEG